MVLAFHTAFFKVGVLFFCFAVISEDDHAVDAGNSTQFEVFSSSFGFSVFADLTIFTSLAMVFYRGI